MSRKQQRAERRLEQAKNRKARRSIDFLIRIAKRRLKEDGQHLSVGFCCWPHSLGMPRDQLLAQGQQLVGGKAVLFGRGELKKLLPEGWRCTSKSSPTMLLRDDINKYFREDGSSTSSDIELRRFTSGSSGSTMNWA